VFAGKMMFEMVTQSIDTDPEVEAKQVSLIRSSSVAERISRMRSLTQSAIQLSRRAIRRANPGLDPGELNLIFVSCHYGEKLAGLLREYLETGK
jgi:hypothetical protein